MIDPQILSFFVLAVASIASASGVIIFRNAVHSALSLILTLLFLALFYLQLGAMFIAVVQILIYAGAIMVLFLFVVTMLASEVRDTTLPDRIPWQRGIAATLGLILVGALRSLLFPGANIDTHARVTGAHSLYHVVRCYNRTNGKPRWKYEPGSGTYQTSDPVAAGRLILFGSGDQNLYAFGA